MNYLLSMTDTKTYITGMTSDQIEAYWDQLERLVEKPLIRLNDKCYTADQIIQKCITYEWQCWAAFSDKEIECVFITFISPFPTGHKVFSIPYVGGNNIEHWLCEAWTLFKEFAKANQCNEIKGGGRQGWLKVIPEQNIRKKLIFSVEI